MNFSTLKVLTASSWPNICFAGILLVFCFGTACQSEQNTDTQHTTWHNYGGGADQSKYVELNGINSSNVSQLQEAWFYPTGDRNIYEFNPIIQDTMMYVLAQSNSLVALDARTGEELWIHADLRGISSRGINYWESADGQDKRLIFQMNDYLQAIDAETGKSIMSFGNDGLVDLKVGLGRDPNTVSRVQTTNPGIVYKNMIIMGSSPGEGYLSAPGHIRAFNVITGEQEWIFHTIPQPGQFGYDTWPEGAYKYAGGVNVWAEMSLDKEHGIVFLPLGSSTYDYYGADRPGKNLFGTSLVAVDASTGERLWHFQLVHHDLWDYDPAAAPQLVTVNHDGEDIDAVAVAGKHGYLFTFNRVTGEPLWPIEERPVPESDVPGEQTWPTQPFPTKPEPFIRHKINPDSLNPYHLTEKERLAWHDTLTALEEEGRMGLFTPVSHKHRTLAMPGAQGGANWGNTAANPEKGIVYVLSKDEPSLYPALEERAFGDNAEEEPGYVNPAIAGSQMYERHCQTCHGLDFEGNGVAPSLADVETRLNFQNFRMVLNSGQGKMPPFSSLHEDDVEAIYRYLGGTRDGKIVQPPPVGPKVVASGGVPGGQQFRPTTSYLGGNYPEDVDAPDRRYYMDGWGLGYAYLVPPPWSTITAYDLNEGTIKWRRPLGTDKLAAQQGGKNTGIINGSMYKGMIATSTGLLFANAGDGKVYAFDAETGDELWAGDLPNGTSGLPSLYEIDGRYYLVVSSTMPLEWGRGVPEYESEEDRPQGGYKVFTLPKQ